MNSVNVQNQVGQSLWRIIIVFHKLGVVCCAVVMMGGPVADAEALVGSLTGKPGPEEETSREVSVSSLSSVPSTILHRDSVSVFERDRGQYHLMSNQSNIHCH